MNKVLSLLVPFMFVFALTPSIHAQVFLDDGELVPTPSGAFGEYVFGLSRTTGFNSGQGQGGFAYGIEFLDSTQLRFSAIAIAERNAIYSVERGETIDSVFALANAPLADNTGVAPTGTLDASAGDSFLLAFYDDTSGLFDGTDEPDSTDNYGWFEFRRTEDSIELVGAATSVGQGIRAGATSVPEPGSSALLLAFGLLVTHRRRA